MSHLDPSDFLLSLPPLLTRTGRSAFTGESLIPPESANVINGFRLTTWQAEQVRDRAAKVLARHASSGEIVCLSATGHKYVLGEGPEAG